MTKNFLFLKVVDQQLLKILFRPCYKKSPKCSFQAAATRHSTSIVYREIGKFHFLNISDSDFLWNISDMTFYGYEIIQNEKDRGHRCGQTADSLIRWPLVYRIRPFSIPCPNFLQTNLSGVWILSGSRECHNRNHNRFPKIGWKIGYGFYWLKSYLT